MEKRLTTAQALLGEEVGGDLKASALAAAFDAPGKKYVPVLIEAEGKSLLEGVSGDQLPVEMFVYALDEEGTVRDYFVRQMTLDLGQVRPRSRSRALSTGATSTWTRANTPYAYWYAIRSPESSRYNSPKSPFLVRA